MISVSQAISGHCENCCANQLFQKFQEILQEELIELLMDGEDAAQSLADNAPFVLSHPPQPQLSPHTSQDTHTK